MSEMQGSLSLKRLILAFACVVTAPLFAQSTDIDGIRQLARDGKLDTALEQINQQLQQTPGERQLRFLKGVILAEKKQPAKAIEVFRKLTVDFPDLPEPYNNLAVLYASQGDYEQARDALLLAINTHPSYATAHENLGDIYAKMAGVAYDKALSIDTSNATAKHKLNLIDNLFVGPGSAAQRKVMAPEPVAEPATTTALEESAPAAPESVQTALVEVDEASVIEAVNAWSKDWAAQDVNAYLGHYAARFRPNGGLTYSAWQQQRRSRLTNPEFIRVKISNPVVLSGSADRAQVEFIQSYQSNTYSGRARKRLTFKMTPQGWKIIREQVQG
jgi:hypothetical protein